MDKIINFIKDNVALCAICAAILVLVIVLIIVLCSVNKKKKKAKELARIEPVGDEQAVLPEEEKEVEEPAEEVKDELVEPVVIEEKQVEESKAEEEVSPQQEVVATVEPVEEVEEPAPVKEEVVQEPVPVEEEVAQEPTPVEEESDKATKRMAIGKWQIIQKGEDEYVSFLYANNGVLLLTSETYSTVKGAMGGIATIKKNVELGKFEVHCDKKGNYYYKLKSSANRLLCVGEVYSSRLSCENSIESVKKFALNAVLADEIVEDKTVIKYEPTGEIAEAKKGYTGKWKIELVDDMYIANLYASNGELLLVSESYTTELSAKNAMENIKKNALASNFVIDKDKTDRYYYKLRNSQKTILCVGETYDSIDSCISAIESVRKFCNSAKLVVAEEE